MVLDPQKETRRVQARPRDNMIARLSTETKHAFKTTEFWGFVAVLAGILLASYIIDAGDGSGDADPFRAHEAWRLVTFLTIGYLVSRGLAKAGSREPYWATERDLPGHDNGDADRDR
jgi:hypothetical protein